MTSEWGDRPAKAAPPCPVGPHGHRSRPEEPGLYDGTKAPGLSGKDRSWLLLAAHSVVENHHQGTPLPVVPGHPRVLGPPPSPWVAGTLFLPDGQALGRTMLSKKQRAPLPVAQGLGNAQQERLQHPLTHGNPRGNKMLLLQVGLVHLWGRGCHRWVSPHHGQWGRQHRAVSRPCARSCPRAGVPTTLTRSNAQTWRGG